MRTSSLKNGANQGASPFARILHLYSNDFGGQVNKVRIRQHSIKLCLTGDDFWLYRFRIGKGNSR